MRSIDRRIFRLRISQLLETKSVTIHRPSSQSTDQSLETLNVFPARLVVENMSDITSKDFLPSRTLVNTDHGDSDWPRRVSNRQSEVGVVGAEVFSNLHVVRDFGDGE